MTQYLATPIGLIVSMLGAVRAVSGASGTPIVLTVGASHGFMPGEWVDVNGVQGNTAANGTWRLAATGSTTITLEGSTSGGAWTSGGVVTPAGWVFLDGASYAWATYPNLRAFMGTTYGGVTNVSWNTPDWDGRFSFGVDASQTRITTGFGHSSGALAVGALGGSHTHTLVGSEFPSHTHGPGDVIGQLLRSDLGWASGYGTFAGGFQGAVLVESGAQTLGVGGSSASSTGGGGHENRHPFMTFHDIMFAGPRTTGPAVLCPIGAGVFGGQDADLLGWVLSDQGPRVKASFPDLHRRLSAVYGADAGDPFVTPLLLGTAMYGGTLAETPGATGGSQLAAIDATTMPVHAHAGGTLGFAMGPTSGEAGGATAGTQFGANLQDRIGINGPHTAPLALGSQFGGGLASTGSVAPQHANLPPMIGMAALLHAGAGVAEFPIGTIARYYTSSPPPNWILLDGRALTRSLYPDLFAKWGTTFGAGNGTTTFNIPDAIGRTIVGCNIFGVNAGGNLPPAMDHIGNTTGSESTQLSSADVPAHRHAVGTLTQSAHASGSESAGQGVPVSGTFQNRVEVVVSGGSLSTYPAMTGASAAQSPNGGATPSHNNLPAYAAMYWVVKAQ